MNSNEYAGTDKTLLTYLEVADRLGVSERTAWSLVAKGILPAVRFGRNVRIDPVDLQKFIDSGKRPKGKAGAGSQP